MNTSRFSASASRFAHLAGFSRKSRAAEDEQRDDDHVDDDKDTKGKKSGRAADDDADDDQDEPKGKKSKRAADGDDDDQDEPKGKKSKRAADGDDDDDQDEPKGKKAKRAADGDDDDDQDDDDDDEKEMSGQSANASARRREQARVGAILGHAAAANNLPLAVSLACETRMTRREAITVLKGQARSSNDRDDDAGNRHARSNRSSRNVNLGGDAPSLSGTKAVDASWGRAFAKAGIANK